MRSLLATIEHDDPALANPVAVYSVQELDAVLDTLAEHSPADAPWMAHVTRANGDQISIGLGRPLVVDPAGDVLADEPRPEATVLSWIRAGGMPPYYVAKGTISSRRIFVFFTYGHWSEFLPEHCLDVKAARRVLREFVTSAGRPASVEWIEV
jgi:hypothetical protein